MISNIFKSLNKYVLLVVSLLLMLAPMVYASGATAPNTSITLSPSSGSIGGTYQDLKVTINTRTSTSLAADSVATYEIFIEYDPNLVEFDVTNALNTSAVLNQAGLGPVTASSGVVHIHGGVSPASTTGFSGTEILATLKIRYKSGISPQDTDLVISGAESFITLDDQALTARSLLNAPLNSATSTYTDEIYTYSLTVPVPIAGSCGATVEYNSCDAGTLVDVADDATNSIWSCNGTGGSTVNVTCSISKKPGTCSTTEAFKCTSGAVSNSVERTTEYTWTCGGIDGGADTNCTLDRTNPAAGVCSTTTNTCTTGTLEDTADTDTEYKWTCKGVDGGTNTACSKTKDVTPVCSTTTKETCTAGTLEDVTDSSTKYLWKCVNTTTNTKVDCSLNKTLPNTSENSTDLASSIMIGITSILSIAFAYVLAIKLRKIKFQNKF